MQLRANIPPALLNAATAALQQHCPELSPTALVAALRQYGEQAAPDVRRRFLTPREFGTIVGASEHSVKRWCQTGKLRACKVGATWRVPADAVDELTASAGEV